ncbi:MAG: acyltransferase [Firmicutes bacterium HGW-Firmicutes-4]|jgi:acetyltransferase-like isoleucine patch superfamily enzyme|nr:MAG: acyltransferase [Firmicutes bacterium HGW-Firmicutes-4]
MGFFKAKYHVRAFIEKIMLKLIYKYKLKIGKNVTWRRNFIVMIDTMGRIIIGDDCFFNNNCSLNANNYIEIGAGSIFGEDVKIYDHNHRFNNREKNIKGQGFSNGEVKIGTNCWIGSNVVILKGATISNNCVIGAGTVIKGYVPEYTIVKTMNQYNYEKIKSLTTVENGG